MLLKQMLESPTTSPNLVVFDPFGSIDRESLVKEVIGLANVKIEGPRNILFGVNPGAMNGSSVIGISDEAVVDLKRAHRLVSSLVEPVLDLAFIFDRINGKLVGALEIDGCDYGPYFLAQDLSDELRRGGCWIREERELIQVDRRELLNGNAQPVEEEVVSISPEDVDISIGFNDDPDCEFIEVAVPDTSDPPFADDDSKTDVTQKTSKIAQAIKDTVSTVTTRILKMAQGDEAGAQVADAANKHYYFEDRAVKVDHCIRNESDVEVKDLSIEFGFPKLPGFVVSDRIYLSPFDKRTEAEVRKMGYPEVEYRGDATIIRANVGFLPGEKTQALLGTSLRIAVGPEALGRKVAMQYVVRGPDRKRLGTGRLKIRLGQKPKYADASHTETAYKNLDEE